MLAEQLMGLSLVIVRFAEEVGGLLLHGALAEREGPSRSAGRGPALPSRSGQGVILAGPGGVGKSTASQRFPPPWHSLCDDSTLVVRDGQGTYWAHPWPTWSRFMFGGPGGSWDVEHAVRLGRIFFLSPSEEDRAEPVGAGQAASLLVESAEQVSFPMQRGLEKAKVRSLRLQRFDNVCALAKAVPTYLLHLSRDGTFWHEIERVLDSPDAP